MPSLYHHIKTPHGRRVVISKPGLYPLRPDLSATRPQKHWPAGVWLALLVCHLGDFLVRRASGSQTPTRHVVRLGGRPLLGDLERLSGDVQVDLSSADSTDLSSCHRVQYRQLDGPPVEFRMPDVSTLRCRYSTRSLAGGRAIRCSGCYLLFSKTTWESELGGKCPACGWSPCGTGVGVEVECDTPF